MKTFLNYLDENHLEPGTTLKKGKEELKVVKPVGDDKYLVKEDELELEEKALTPTHEETIHVGHRNSKGDWVKTSTHSNYHDAKKAMDELEKRGKKGVQHRYDNKRSIEPGAMMQHKVAESTVIRTQNGRKMVSAEVAIRLAREIAAKRKEGETATTNDLKHATKALTREEAEQIDELSSDTLKSYANKRRDQIKDRYSKLMATK